LIGPNDVGKIAPDMMNVEMTRFVAAGMISVALAAGAVASASPGAVTSTEATAASAKPGPVTIVEEGRPLLPIIAGSVEAAVTDLRDMIERISGARLTVKPAGDAPPSRGGVYVGLVADFPQLDVAGAGGLGAEGFIIRTDGVNLCLLGEQPAGVQHAVTTLLRHLGHR
jgi:hypothetical protein